MSNLVSAPAAVPLIKERVAIESDQATVLADIYSETANIAIWKREFSTSTRDAINATIARKPSLKASMTVTAKSAHNSLRDLFGHGEEESALVDDIAELVDMYTYLFDLPGAGLRLTTLDRAMCPRFHVDRVPCRLVTTYQGSGTQWLPQELVDRSKLGAGNQGLPDEESGIYRQQEDIHQLNTADVALLKGELWHGNEDAGIVHRSPPVAENESRLLLTLDFVG